MSARHAIPGSLAAFALRRALAVAAALALPAAFAGPLSVAAPCLSQEAPAPPARGGEEGAAASDSTDDVLIEAVALDYSAMLRARHGPGDEASDTPILLPGVPIVSVIFDGDSGASHAVKSRTDASGHARFPLGAVPEGSRVYFAVPPGEGGKTASSHGWYAKPWNPAAEDPPQEIRFYRVAESPDALVQKIDQVVTLGEEGGSPNRFLLVAQDVLVQNLSFDVWLGEGSFARQSGSFHVPIPRGMEVWEVLVDGKPVKDWRRQHMPHGGDSIVWMEPIYPSIPPERGLFVRALFRGDYESGRVYDIGSHLEYPTDQYGLYLQEDLLHFVPPEDGVTLQDMGTNLPMGEDQISTHGWGLMQVPAHTTVAASFAGGMHPRTIKIVVVIVLVIGGAIGLGWFLSSRRVSAGTAGASPSRPSAGDGPIASRLRELEARYRRGEITSVEFQARRAVLAGRSVAGPLDPRRTTAGDAAPAGDMDSASDTGSTGGAGRPGGPRTAVRGDLLQAVRRIAAKKPEKSTGRVGKDLRVLARALEELLRDSGR